MWEYLYKVVEFSYKIASRIFKTFQGVPISKPAPHTSTYCGLSYCAVSEPLCKLFCLGSLLRCSFCLLKFLHYLENCTCQRKKYFNRYNFIFNLIEKIKEAKVCLIVFCPPTPSELDDLACF